MPDSSPIQRQERLRLLAGLGREELLIHEIYRSLQGESSYAGRPCTFVRTAVCDLRCSYCDTASAFTQGEAMTIEAVLARVDALGSDLVEVTGGEPLLQPQVPRLLARLCDRGATVLLETSGALDIRIVDERVIRIVDLKTPSSGESENNLLSNLHHLRATDEVKFVIGSRADYEWAYMMLKEHHLDSRARVLMGAVWETIEPSELARWIVADGLDVRMQLQTHKYIWGARERGV